METRIVVIATVFGRMEADILKSYLEANGIRCEISQEAAASVYSANVGVLGKADLLVPADQADAARELMEAFEHPSDEEFPAEAPHDQLPAEEETDPDAG